MSYDVGNIIDHVIATLVLPTRHPLQVINTNENLVLSKTPSTNNQLTKGFEINLNSVGFKLINQPQTRYQS